MTITHGIAGVPGGPIEPEVEGIYVFESEADVSYWAHMGLEQDHPSIDVWSFEFPDEQSLILDENGFHYVPTPVPPEKVHLHVEGWTRRNPSSVVTDVFWKSEYREQPNIADLLADEAFVVELDGTRHEGRAAAASWLSDLEVRRKVAREQGLRIYVPDDVHALLDPWGGSKVWTLVEVQENAVVAIREFASERDARAFAGDTDDD